ncbi:MAG: hypothetical protein KR126chlam2_00303 [Chlamydiae bacterium]|nr:hypothetical protein [Chlamydiota bacterium]
MAALPSIRSNNIYFHPTPAKATDRLLLITMVAATIIFTILGITVIGGWVSAGIAPTAIFPTIFFRYVLGGILAGLGPPIVAACLFISYVSQPKHVFKNLLEWCSNDQFDSLGLKWLSANLRCNSFVWAKPLLGSNTTLLSVRKEENGVEHHLFDQAYSLAPGTSIRQFVQSNKDACLPIYIGTTNPKSCIEHVTLSSLEG